MLDDEYKTLNELIFDFICYEPGTEMKKGSYRERRHSKEVCKQDILDYVHENYERKVSDKVVEYFLDEMIRKKWLHIYHGYYAVVWMA